MMGHYYADMACSDCGRFPCRCPCAKCGGHGGKWSGTCTCPVEPMDWTAVQKVYKELYDDRKKKREKKP